MKPVVDAALRSLFRAYLRRYPAWGSLHVVLEDGNVKDSHVEFCLQQALEKGDEEGAALARILLECSQTQRRKIASIR